MLSAEWKVTINVLKIVSLFGTAFGRHRIMSSDGICERCAINVGP